MRRRKKRPVTGYLDFIVRKDYERSRAAERIRNPQHRTECLADIAIAQKQWDEAEILLQKLNNEQLVIGMRMMKALYQRDWEHFNELRQMTDSEVLRLAVDTEEAFAQRQLDKAEQLGKVVIDRTEGLQRYVFEKGLELSRSDPTRDTYF